MEEEESRILRWRDCIILEDWKALIGRFAFLCIVIGDESSLAIPVHAAPPTETFFSLKVSNLPSLALATVLVPSPAFFFFLSYFLFKSLSNDRRFFYTLN